MVLTGEMEHWQVRRIVSGGQTGVDRAALDVALELGLEHGGWCPRGRKAEDGCINEKYRLRETVESQYHVRTGRNVIESDGTLILALGELTGGTELTRRLAVKHRRPLLVVDPRDDSSLATAQFWLAEERIKTLNVGGPRESSSPGIYELARDFLRRLWSR